MMAPKQPNKYCYCPYLQQIEVYQLSVNCKTSKMYQNFLGFTMPHNFKLFNYLSYNLLTRRLNHFQITLRTKTNWGKSSLKNEQSLYTVFNYLLSGCMWLPYTYKRNYLSTADLGKPKFKPSYWWNSSTCKVWCDKNRELHVLKMCIK